MLAETGPRYASIARPEELERKAALCEAALNGLKKALERAVPDVVLIVGDNQGELFGPDNQPAFAIYHHNKLVTSDAFGHEGQPDWIHKMGRGYLMDERHPLRGNAAFALQLIEGLVERGVDVAMVANIREGSKAGLGHAFGFVVRRLMGDRPAPIVPLLLNTYFPPNVSTAARCGRRLKRLRRCFALRSWRPVASAILWSTRNWTFVSWTPFAMAIQRRSGPFRDARSTRAHPKYQTGFRLPVQSATYLPLYRTPAGTGVGAAFVVWADSSEA